MFSGSRIPESLGSSISFIYQQCDLTLPLSLVLTSNREITSTLPTSQGCCEALAGVCESIDYKSYIIINVFVSTLLKKI